MKCSHCGDTLIKHTGSREGFNHCNGCGCCFDGKEVREGHTQCSASLGRLEVLDAEEAPTPPKRTRKP